MTGIVHQAQAKVQGLCDIRDIEDIGESHGCAMFFLKNLAVAVVRQRDKKTLITWMCIIGSASHASS